MATWVLRHAPWAPLSRVRLRLELLDWSSRQGLGSPALVFKHFFSTPLLPEESPAMLEMKNTPYPSMPLDTSIFEDVSEGYDSSILGAEDARLHAVNPSDLLVTLVKDGNFLDADRVHAELTEMGISISPAPAYGDAAVHVLQQEYQNPLQRLSAFVKWWSLIPHKSSATRMSVSRVGRIIYQESIPDLSLIMRFALLSASKGYATTVATQAISLVVRYASPLVSASFLQAFHQAALPSTESPHDQSNERDLQRQRTWFSTYAASWYSCAIRGYCMTGRLSNAVHTLQIARSHGLLIDPSTYESLLRRLERSLAMDSISLVKELRRTQLGISQRDLVGLVPSSAPLAYSPPTEFSNATSFSDIGSLAAALRILKRHMSSAVRYPRPSILASFITAYKAAGHDAALHILRKRSYTASLPTTSMWALTEMLFHFRRKEGILVILVFTHHFHAVGIPKRVYKYISRTERRLNREPELRPEVFQHVIYPQYPLEKKLWPSTHHTALVWRVASEFMKEPQQLEKLYEELLAQVAISRSQQPSPDSAHSVHTDGFTESQVPDNLEPITPPILFNSAHFNVFIYAFAKQISPYRAAKVIADMYRVGISPSVESLNMLTAAFARIGDVQKLTMLLDCMEETQGETSGVESHVQDDGDRLTNSSPVAKTGQGKPLPPPNVVTYTAIIRYLIQSQLYMDALSIATRLRTKAGYVPGTNPITDEVLQELTQYYGDLYDEKGAHSVG